MIDPEGKGISRTAIIGYEQGSTKPGLREIKLLCEVLRVSPNWLIYGTDAAAKATLASGDLLSRGDRVRDVFVTALALMALKGHERDALQALVLSLAGRQLGDMRLSALLAFTFGFRNAFEAYLRDACPEVTTDMTIEELAEVLSQSGVTTNAGNRFRLDDEGEVLNPESAVYPDPKKKS